MKPVKEHLFYFDCEWVPQYESIIDLRINDHILYEAFLHQCEKWNRQNAEEGKNSITSSVYWKEKAHFYPEYCKIICVSYGYYNKGEFIIKSLYGADEKKLLSPIPELFEKIDRLGWILCGYAIKRFDMPWLSKRMMANGITPPPCLSVYGKKPWEVNVFDLPEVWGQGVMGESYTPFELACAALGIESSKDELDGSKVAEAFYNGEIIDIKNYCEKDVLKTSQLAAKLIDLLP